MKSIVKRLLKSVVVFFISVCTICSIMCCVAYNLFGDITLYRELIGKIVAEPKAVNDIFKTIFIYATFITAMYYCFGSENSNEIKKIGRYIKNFVLWEIIFVVLFVLSTPVRVIHYSVILPLLAIICTYLIKKYKNVSLWNI